MRRLPPQKRDTVRSMLADTPENCSALFLLDSPSSVVVVDHEHTPKFFSISYPHTFPPLYFLYGETDQLIISKRFFKLLKEPADLVVPHSLFPVVNRYWPVRFALPVLFMAAPQDWRPASAPNFRVRLLHPEEAGLLEKAFAAEDWLWDFFGSPARLLTKGQAAAAFIDGELASVATTLAYTRRYCELGVATRPAYQGRGLALECARLLSRAQFEEFDRLPCWRTHTGNIGSWKTALRLGLVETPLSEQFVFLSNYEHVGALAGVAP
ncbi:MAG: GNAT family N-acetyltransferase [Firmicutes bacterium]|nr:GNAT family N-acetyltransferase [Bacillota bacterium]